MSSTLGASLLRTVLSDGTLKILGSGLDKGPIILEEHKNISSKLDKAKLEERCWRSVSVIALIIAILSFLQSLHIIDLSVH